MHNKQVSMSTSHCDIFNILCSCHNFAIHLGISKVGTNVYHSLKMWQPHCLPGQGHAMKRFLWNLDCRHVSNDFLSYTTSEIEKSRRNFPQGSETSNFNYPMKSVGGSAYWWQGTRWNQYSSVPCSLSIILPYTVSIVTVWRCYVHNLSEGEGLKMQILHSLQLSA